MADSIQDLLNNRQFKEPDEIKLIKDFVRHKFDSECSVSIHTRQVVISVDNSSLAAALRMHIKELEQLCPTGKRPVIRIS
jgi:hypothetical protein